MTPETERPPAGGQEKISCGRCGREIVKKDSTGAFYKCEGNFLQRKIINRLPEGSLVDYFKHHPYLVSVKFSKNSAKQKSGEKD